MDREQIAAEPIAPVINANRHRIDNRYPGLAFTVRTGSLPYFEVLLTTDRSLYIAANAGRRDVTNFYASRQDSGLIHANGGDAIYLVPPAVLKSFAQSHPSEIFYTLIAYRDQNGNGPAFALPPEALPDEAPSVSVASDFRGHALSMILGIPAHMLRRVGGESGALAQYTSSLATAYRPAPDPLVDRAEGEDGFLGTASGSASNFEGEQLGDEWQTALGDSSADVWNSQDEYDLYHAPADPAGEEPARSNGHAAAASYEMSGNGQGDGGFVYEDGYEDQGPIYGNSAIQSAAQASVFPKGMQEPHPLYDDEQTQEGEFGDAGFAYDENSEDEGDSLGVASAAEQNYGYNWDAQGADSFSAGQLSDDDDSYSSQDGHGDDEYQMGWEGSGFSAAAGSHYGDEGELAYEALEAPSPVVAGGSTGAGSAVVAGRTQPLTIQEKRRTIERIAPFESGRDLYTAINSDGEFSGRFGTSHPAYQRFHIGLSYGIIQFTQDSGALGRLLAMMRDRDPATFSQIFGPDSDQLVRITSATGPASSQLPGGRSARVQPIGGADLWQPPWVARFQQAGNHVPFQAAQNELASNNYIDTMLRFAACLDLVTDRALTMVVDRAIQMGVGGAKRWIMDAVGPVQTASQRQQALTALHHADLRSFQSATGGLRPDGQWGPMTHAAMVGALRSLGVGSPVPIPTRDQMLDAMARRASGQAWARRVTELRNDRSFTDIPYQS